MRATASRPADRLETDLEELRAASPRLGPVEWLRWAWRQLTSMRTALMLLLLLAIAAVPGSLIPQKSADPNGVAMWKSMNPRLVPLMTTLQAFDVYSSVWFSAIYLLLFVSLIGCVVPRVRHHLLALRTPPPRTPARLDRLPAHESRPLSGDAEAALVAAERLLRRRRYRVRRYGDSVAAERGHLRETGNLAFHLGLVGLLVAVYIGSGFTYTGQRVVVEGQSFINYLAGYDSFTPGRYFTASMLQPYRLQLQDLAVRYEQRNPAALGQPIDYTATVRVQDGSRAAETRTIKVNQPLDVGGSTVYLLGNGYAPHITVRDGRGRVAFSDYVPFLPQDSKLTSLGVIKAPDARPQQLGLVGFLYPTVIRLGTGALTSLVPSLGDPLISLRAYTGDLGLNAGVPVNVYALNTSRLTEIVGPRSATKAVQLRVGQTARLPGGAGSVSLDRIARFASFEIHRDPSQGWVAGFVVLAVAGLLVSLLVPRRRVWIRVRRDAESPVIEYAGLARGDDAGLSRHVQGIAREHAETSAADRDARAAP